MHTFFAHAHLFFEGLVQLAHLVRSPLICALARCLVRCLPPPRPPRPPPTSPPLPFPPSTTSYRYHSYRNANQNPSPVVALVHACRVYVTFQSCIKMPLSRGLCLQPGCSSIALSDTLFLIKFEVHSWKQRIRCPSYRKSKWRCLVSAAAGERNTSAFDAAAVNGPSAAWFQTTLHGTVHFCCDSMLLTVWTLKLTGGGNPWCPAPVHAKLDAFPLAT
jgi:hypothetical protein